MSKDAEDYQQVLVRLLPSGDFWESLGAAWDALLLGIAQEYARIDEQTDSLIDEADPRTAFDTLTRWEDLFELPSTGTTSERQARITAREISTQGTRPADYQEQLAAILGLTPSQVEIIERKAGSPELGGDPQEIFKFFIFRDPALGGSYSIEDAQAEADSMNQDHTTPVVIESINFLCDDPYSLCDRDLLGI